MKQSLETINKRQVVGVTSEPDFHIPLFSPPELTQGLLLDVIYLNINTFGANGRSNRNTLKYRA